MGARAAFREGIRRVNSSPVLLLGMFAVTLLLALPLSLALREMLAAHLGTSLAAETATSGANYDWWQEFLGQAAGLGTTFLPSIIGFGAVLENLSGLLDNLPLASTITGVTAAWLIVWSFLSGGILDRYARNRPTRSHGFFAACGTHFWRFLRLGVLALADYYVLFAIVHPFLFDTVYRRATDDLAVERAAFAIRVGLYLLFGAVLVICSIVFDYARIRIVVEDRRSAVGALFGAIRFVARHPGRTLGLYVVNGIAFIALIGLYALLAPGAPGSGVGMIAVLLMGEIYILGRHYLKLLFYASQTALFQGALAHASYTAAPAVVWPDSPAVESIVNAEPSGSSR
jgi:hypothetical protein